MQFPLYLNNSSERAQSWWQSGRCYAAYRESLWPLTNTLTSIIYAPQICLRANKHLSTATPIARRYLCLHVLGVRSVFFPSKGCYVNVTSKNIGFCRKVFIELLFAGSSPSDKKCQELKFAPNRNPCINFRIEFPRSSSFLRPGPASHTVFENVHKFEKDHASFPKHTQFFLIERLARDSSLLNILATFRKLNYAFLIIKEIDTLLNKFFLWNVRCNLDRPCLIVFRECSVVGTWATRNRSLEFWSSSLLRRFRFHELTAN